MNKEKMDNIEKQIANLEEKIKEMEDSNNKKEGLLTRLEEYYERLKGDN